MLGQFERLPKGGIIGLGVVLHGFSGRRSFTTPGKRRLKSFCLRDQSWTPPPDLGPMARKPSSLSSYRHSRPSGGRSARSQSIGSKENDFSVGAVRPIIIEQSGKGKATENCRLITSWSTRKAIYSGPCAKDGRNSTQPSGASAPTVTPLNVCKTRGARGGNRGSLSLAMSNGSYFKVSSLCERGRLPDTKSGVTSRGLLSVPLP